jgi:hypothetical protein
MARSNAKLQAVPLLYTNDQIINAATGRWGEVAQEVKLAEPYVIGRPDDQDPIIVAPLTRRRRKALKAAQAAYIMLGAQLVKIQEDQTADQGTIDRINSTMEEADETYNKALFGDAYDAVVALYEDLQEELWDAMYNDLHAALVNRVALPEDVCPKCGQKVEVAGEEGKDESSSTSSTSTGTK